MKTPPWIPIAVAAALAFVPLPASAVLTCVATQSGTWGPMGSGTAVWDCGGEAPDAGHRFEIPNGITVDVTTDLIQNPSAPTSQNIGIDVLSGGTLSAIVTQTTGPFTISYGLLALDCQPGSTCTFEGAYREFGSATPTLQTSIDAAGSLTVGDVIPCPGFDASEARAVADCDGSLSDTGDSPGDPNTVRFSYPTLLTDTSPLLFIPEAIDALAPGDSVCFFDPDPGTPDAPVNDGFCYEITDANEDESGVGIGPAFIEIDVRQTDPANPKDTGYPLARRQIKHASLDASVSDGDRWITLADDSVIDSPGDLVGRWLRFEDDGAPEDQSYIISRTEDDIDCNAGSGKCDRFELADPSGAARARSASDPDEDEVWIDYGFAAGESFFVMAPLTITDSDNDPDTGEQIRFAGTLTLQSVLTDAVEGIEVDPDSLVLWENVWFRDVENENSDGASLKNVDGATFTRWSMTGGDSGGDPLDDDQVHAITIKDSSMGFSFDTIAIRHHGDDCLSNSEFYGIAINRMRCEFVTDNAPSTNLLGINNVDKTVTGTMTDIACIDCTGTDDIVIADKTDGVNPASLTINGFLALGSDPKGVGARIATTTVTDFIGINAGSSIPIDVDRFVMRDSIRAGNSGSAVLGQAIVTNGVVSDIDVVSGDYALSGDATVENVAWINLLEAPGSTVSFVFQLRPPPTSPTSWDDVTIAWSPGLDPGFEKVFWLGGSPQTGWLNFSMQGLLVAGFSGTSGTGPTIDGAGTAVANLFAATTEGPFLYDNGTDVDDPADLPLSASTGVAPGFVDPSAGRFDPILGGAADLAGSGIRFGVDAPGVANYRWIHAITRLKPEIMAEDPDRDGVPEDPTAPLCTDDADDCSDNCPFVFNPDQADADNDGRGNSCEVACGDGVDNDGDGAIDWDGAGTGVPDPQCQMRPDWISERGSGYVIGGGCGLGAELSLLLPLGLWLRGRVRSRNRRM